MKENVTNNNKTITFSKPEQMREGKSHLKLDVKIHKNAGGHERNSAHLLRDIARLRGVIIGGE